MNLREAAELAMWTLESTGTDPSDPKQAIQYNRELKTIERLRQALAQPVLYMDSKQMPEGMPDWKPGMVYPKSKREWVGLTDEDLKLLRDEWHIVYGSWNMDFARAIEAKLKEKNS